MVKRFSIIWTLVSLILVIKVTSVKCSTFYTVVRSPSDWQIARSHCSDKFNGSLLSSEAPETVLDHVTSIEYGEDIWTNAYFTLSPWIIYKGCFDNTKIASSEFYHIIPSEHKQKTLGSCFRSCSEVKTPYFGFQGKTCFCLTSLQHFVKNDSKCSHSCGDTLAQCGGPDAVSVFENYLPSKENIHEDRRCATVMCGQGDKHVYRAHKCSNRFKALCGNGDVSLGKQPFKDSKQFCNQRMSHIVNDDVDQVCRDIITDNITQYWIDMHRYPVGPFQADSNDSEVYPFSCVKYNNETFLQESCDENQLFLCVVDIAERNAHLLCTEEMRNWITGFIIEDSRVVNVSMETMCERVQPSVYMKYLTYSGVIGLAVSGGLVFLGCCIVSLICCTKRTKKPDEKQPTEMTTVQYSPVKKTNDI